MDANGIARFALKLIAYAKQPSTRRGIVYILGAAGIVVQPAWMEAFLVGIFLVNGLINTLRNEDKPRLPPSLTAEEVGTIEKILAKSSKQQT